MEIRLLDAAAARAALAGLAEVLADCVEDGASVGFMAPFTVADAARYYEGVCAAVGRGASLLLVARAEGRIVGTVQLGIEQFPNQPHRADLKKLLVHRSARGKGVASALMHAAEDEAERRGKRLLVLDTATGSPAEGLYQRLGWTLSGIIPDYALYPDGRFCATSVYFRRLGPPLGDRYAADPASAG
nr:GNAT family N-acetyltransferase [uncultured Gellertiella sp.]